MPHLGHQKVTAMGLLPDTQNCGLRMRWKCCKRFPLHWLQRKLQVSDPNMHQGTCITHVPWCMSGSLTHVGRENVPGIPGACATRHFAHLVRGPWSWMANSITFVQWQAALLLLTYCYYKIWPWKSMVKAMCVVKNQDHIWAKKIKGQIHGHGQTHWSHLRPKVQSICLLFILWQSDHFLLRYSKFHIWPWKFKLKVMAKVKPNGHIWSLEFNQYVCFLFRGNQTSFGSDISNSIFGLQVHGHNDFQPKSKWTICKSGPSILPKIKEIWKVVWKLSCGQKCAAGRDFAKSSSFLQCLPSGNRGCLKQNLISVSTLKQSTSCDLTNIKSNCNMFRSDWKCFPVHKYWLNQSLLVLDKS